MSGPKSGQSVTLQPGSRLGPYEVLSLLGAGGMGEVYRARDTRLAREVALKILPNAAGEDTGRFRRFQTEAKAAAALSHPNIVAVHDIGREGGTAYIVSELVAGGTLTSLLERGPLPARRLLDLAIPMAEALAAAHANGIVHRDLKPDNILVTPEGAPKIADFGLAKYLAPVLSEESLRTTLPEDRTREGTIVGTVGYMSPEQAEGKPVDYRSDQFSFGSVLYEMATGHRAFQRKSVIDTLASIIHEEPEPIEKANPRVPGPLRWIIERCHAKDPRKRYASTEDLARELAVIRDHFSEAVSGAALAAAPPRPRRALWLGAAAAALVVASLFAGKVLWRQPPASPPTFHQLTFRRGFLWRARFASDGHTVAYSARWEGEQGQTVFTQRLDAPSARPQEVLKARILAVSGGEMAVRLPGGILARVPLTGGTPREIAEDVTDADWRGSDDFAIVRRVGDRQRLEWPVGRVLHQGASVAFINSPRISQGGDRIAFLEGRQQNLLASVVVVDRDGRSRALSKDWLAPEGVAWSPDGREIWFSGAREKSAPDLHAVGLDGRERVVAQVPGGLRVHDTLPDGRALLSHETYRNEAWGQLAGDEKPRDLTWSEDTFVTALSDDGRAVLFQHAGEFAGGSIATYLRRVADPAPVLLGEGWAMNLSRDGAWAVSAPASREAVVLLHPTGPGKSRRIRFGTLAEIWEARITRDGRRLVFTGREAGRSNRLFTYDLPGGPLKPLTPEGIGVETLLVTPDGQWVAALPPGAGPRPFVLFPLEGGEPRPITGIQPDELPAAWSADGRFLFVKEPESDSPTETIIARLDTQTGARKPWLRFELPDTAGAWVSWFSMTPDGRHWAASYLRRLSDLYFVEGLR